MRLSCREVIFDDLFSGLAVIRDPELPDVPNILLLVSDSLVCLEKHMFVEMRQAI